MTGLSASAWGFEPVIVVCANCDWRFLLPVQALPQNGASLLQCPHCYTARLSALQGGGEELEKKLPFVSPPELLLPHSLPPDRLAERVRIFAQGIPFAPSDLNSRSLAARLKRVYLPLWLVDAGVRASWQFEAGFDYQVVSHQERFSDSAGGWRTQEVNETRVRWEPRQGWMDRIFPNRTAPALEAHVRLHGLVGEFDTSQAQAYTAQAASDSFVRLPDRSQQDAWQDILPGLQASAARECQAACGAEHNRDFRWSPEYQTQNWTLLLRPVFTTFYLDDQNQPKVVLINGQSGQISGVRKASMKRAQRAALLVLAAAVLVFALSVVIALAGVAVPVLLPFGGMGVLVAVLIGLGALIPIIMAWNFNRSNHP